MVVFLTELAKKALSTNARHGDFGILSLDVMLTSWIRIFHRFTTFCSSREKVDAKLCSELAGK